MTHEKNTTPWSWKKYTGLTRFPDGMQKRLERVAGVGIATRAIMEGLVGMLDEKRRPLVLPLYDTHGGAVSAVRIDLTGKSGPVRLRDADVGLTPKTPVWLCNHRGVDATLDAAHNKDLHLTLSPADCLSLGGDEPCICITSRASFNELLLKLEARSDWKLPVRAVLHYGKSFYPLQSQAIREKVGIPLLWVKTDKEKHEEKLTAAKSSEIFLLGSGKLAHWSETSQGGAWRESAKGNGVNLLVGRGYSVTEARGMIPALRTAIDYTFDPMTTKNVIHDGAEVFLNTYGGFSLRPRKMPWGLIWQVLDNLVGGDKEGMEFVLDWLASPLISLLSGGGSERNMSSLVFHGTQGTGKGWVVEALRAIYSRYMIEIGQDQLEDSFEHAKFRQSLLIIANEVNCNSRKTESMMGRLKSWVTEPIVSVRRMRTEAEEYKIHFNMIFFSNLDKPLPLEEGDRRFSVFWSDKRLDPELVRSLRAEKKRGWPSASGFLQALLERRVARELWHPHRNEHRERLIQLARSSAAVFVQKLRSEGFLALGREWLREEAAKNKRAGLEHAADPPMLTNKNGFVLLGTISEVYRIWAKAHNHKDVVSSSAMRREIERAFPALKYDRGRVTSVYGWGFEDFPLTPTDIALQPVREPPADVVDGGDDLINKGALI